MEQNQTAMPGSQAPKAKSLLLPILLIAAFLILILAAIGVPIYLRAMERKEVAAPQSAINAIRKVYDVYWSENGSFAGLTSEDAVERADLSGDAKDKWDYEVVMKTEEEYQRALQLKESGESPYLTQFKYILATSKKANRKGERKQIWYSPDNSRFHGAGIDLFTDPDEEFEYLRSAKAADDSPGNRRPNLSRSRQRSLAEEAQSAINTIRKAYDIYRNENGTTEGYTAEAAARDATLGSSTLRNWSFSVRGQPISIYLAETTAQSSAGAGYKVWYDVNEAKFHGVGIDNLTSP